MSRGLACACVTALGLVLPAAVWAQGKPELVGVLQAAGKYVAEYERQISAVVSEESYLQRYTRTGGMDRGVRRLKSDLLVINDEGVGWIGFRDVYDVDGFTVRDRDERLKKLFIEPSPDSYDQALRIAKESARYNLVEDVLRTINIPMMALRFLTADRQGRSHWRAEGMRTVEGVRVMELKFQEFERPRIIQTTDEAAAHGQFWIDPASGRVIRSELFIETGDMIRGTLSATVRATYAYIEKIDIWMPVTMEEEYRVRGMLVEGRATYANFRKFTVDTNTIIK